MTVIVVWGMMGVVVRGAVMVVIMVPSSKALTEGQFCRQFPNGLSLIQDGFLLSYKALPQVKDGGFGLIRYAMSTTTTGVSIWQSANWPVMSIAVKPMSIAVAITAGSIPVAVAAGSIPIPVAVCAGSMSIPMAVAAGLMGCPSRRETTRVCIRRDGNANEFGLCSPVVFQTWHATDCDGGQ